MSYTNLQDTQRLEINGIQYFIEKIKLTSGWFSAPYYAYGLRTHAYDDHVSYLIFPGTTTPSDNGFLAGLLADTYPWGAIGTQLYKRGQQKIQQWINSEYQRTNRRVMCVGQSLGGAMSIHAHIHQPSKVDFFVVNPPSLTDREKLIYEDASNYPHNCCDDNSRTLKVVSHINDPVWALGDGYFPHGTQVFRYGNQNEHSLGAHARTADCHAQTVEPQFVNYENDSSIRHRAWTILKPILYIVVILLHVIAWPIRAVIQIILSVPSLFKEKGTTPLLPLAQPNSSSYTKAAMSMPVICSNSRHASSEEIQETVLYTNSFPQRVNNNQHLVSP